MNRYPTWKYIIIGIILIVSAIYTLPNFFGQAPALQISAKRQTVKIENSMAEQVKKSLAQEKINYTNFSFADNMIKVRFDSPNDQLKASDVIKKEIDPENYVVALNSVANAPDWMGKIGARPMALGLDLRGGVHFTMAVDMKAALEKTMDRFMGDIRRSLKDKNITADKIEKKGNALIVTFADATKKAEALKVLNDNLLGNQNFQGLEITSDNQAIHLQITDAYLKEIQTNAVKQNIATLHKRINELGVTEPTIQQSGPDRILLQLPGVQDPAQAKEIIGRTATLEVHMVEDDKDLLAQALEGNVPDEYILLNEKRGENFTVPILLKKQVELTGDNINNAAATRQENKPGISVSFDNAGARIFADLTRDNLGNRMAMVLIEQGNAEVVTAPVINDEILGGSTFISGSMSFQEAGDTALLLRSGSLAAPMNIIEERTIGPSLGADQISRGFHSVLWGFVLVGAFMIVYYRLFGIFSVLAMSCNLLLLVAILSLLQATLTLPGIAAIALTMGMAIDANVLVNERIREELRAGNPPQAAITLGYQHAWATIVDSNVTSFIAGMALLIFGTGPIRGFAVVHCIGIVTSVFTSVVVCRAFVNLWYGNRRKLKTLSIGQIWHADQAIAVKD